MSLAYIVAKAPWGPVRIEAAGSMGELLESAGQPPERVEDCGEADAGRVAETARQALGGPDADGWIKAKVAEAVRAVQDARARVLATVAAAMVEKAAHGPPDGHGAAVAMAQRPISLAVTGAGVLEARTEAAATMMTNDDIQARVAVRPMATNGDIQAPARETPALPVRHVPKRPITDVRAIRDKFGMSQSRFALAFGIALQTLQDWEQGRSSPDQAARSFLRVIERQPDAVRLALDEDWRRNA